MFEPGKPIVTLTDAAATQVRALMAVSYTHLRAHET